MPGIVGIISQMAREEAQRELLQMVETLRHENFYVAGMWSDESLGIYVGWVAREGSFSDCMPLRNETADTILLFSGEEFPEPGTIERLRAQGHEINGDGPSYLVHMAEEDPTFPAKLNGRFHGLLVDRPRHAATLFNDRYGMHRLYFHQSREAFYFSAEAKAILAVRPELRRLDPRGVGEFVACGAVMENRTLFDGVRLLPQGSAWVFQNGALQRKDSYFNAREWEEQEPLGPEKFYAELREVFKRNLPRYFSGREKIAMSLTGGLDTRMIMAWHDAPPGALPCYTFGSMFRDCRDVTCSKQLAGMSEQPHQVITVGKEFLSQFPRYAECAVHLSDGCVDIGRSPDVYVNEKARGIAPVRMTGNYGGEILRGIRTFKPEEPSAGVYTPEFLAHVRQAGETYAGILRGHPLSFILFKQLPWNHFGILALEESQLSLRSPFLDNDLIRIVFRAPAAALTDNEVSLRLIGDGNLDLLRIRTDRGLAGGGTGISRTVIRAFLEFQFKAEYAYDMGMPQFVARLDHLLSALHLERLFLGRHKVFHFRIWYRDALAGYLRDVLLDERSISRPYIDRKGLESIVNGHLKGDHNYTAAIHKILALELVQRRLLESTEIRPKANAPVAVAVCVR